MGEVPWREIMHVCWMHSIFISTDIRSLNMLNHHPSIYPTSPLQSGLTALDNPAYRIRCTKLGDNKFGEMETETVYTV